MNKLNYVQPVDIDLTLDHVKEASPDLKESSSCPEKHLSGNFSLSDYEDDDEDPGFCCPCCLPR